jgi:hypothetical protein
MPGAVIVLAMEFLSPHRRGLGDETMRSSVDIVLGIARPHRVGRTGT